IFKERSVFQGDEPIGDVGCSEGSALSASRELCCCCGHRLASHDAAVQVNPEVQAHTQATRPSARKDRAVGTDPWLGKKSVGTQANFYAKVVTTQSVQTEKLQLLGTASATASITSTATATSTTTTTTTTASSVPPETPVVAPATPVPTETTWSPVPDDPDDSTDPLYEPFVKQSFVEDDPITSQQPAHKERKFIVFESRLRQLFRVCQTCYSPCKVSTSTNTTLLTVHTLCPAGHSHRWDSMPSIKGRAVGTLLLSGAILFTGSSPTKTLRLFKLINIHGMCEKTYFNYQRTILLQAIEQVWTDEQGKLMDELHDQPLDLAGDGRCDSPGFCAKYLTYSLPCMWVTSTRSFTSNRFRLESARQSTTVGRWKKKA
ncbi:unnamed protein product, partial [Ixodes hexagonus]